MNNQVNDQVEQDADGTEGLYPFTVQLLGASGESREEMLVVYDPDGVLDAMTNVPDAVSTDLWQVAGADWPDAVFGAAVYSLGQPFHGGAEFTISGWSEAGNTVSGEWRLGEGQASYWQAEREVRLRPDGVAEGRWTIYLAPSSDAPDLARDIVGQRRLALPLTTWLDDQPVLGSSISFSVHNLFSRKPPAANLYPHLRDWGEDSIYERIRLTNSIAF